MVNGRPYGRGRRHAARPVVLTTEGTAVTATITVFDVAGNAATFTTPAVKIDKAPPTARFGSPSPAPNAAGWNNTDVSIPLRPPTRCRASPPRVAATHAHRAGEILSDAVTDDAKVPRRAIFIVRLARDELGRVSGVIERVRTGAKVPVDSLARVGEVLAEMLAADAAERPRAE